MELRLGRRAFLVPIIAAVLIALAAIGGFTLTRDDAQDQERDAFFRDLVAARFEFANTVQVAVQSFAQLGVSGVAPTADARAAGIDAIELVGPQGPANLSPALQSSLDVARDTGAVRATPPLRRPGYSTPVVLLVQPRYQEGMPHTTTASRRAGLTGFVVAILSPAAAAGQAFQGIDGSVVVHDGGDVLLRAGTTGNDDPIRARFDVAGRSWQIDGRAHTGNSAATPIVLLIVGLTLAGGMLFTGQALHQIEAQATARAEDREDDLSTIAAVGPLLQQSLDLAEVLPAATSFLADRFSLDGVAVAYVDEGGDLVQAFSLGHRVPGIVERLVSVPAPPAEVKAGEAFAIPLLRGGRAVGALYALPRRNLSQERTRTLVSVADLFGTAVANARQYEREQLAVKRLQDLDRLKTEFLGTVSHELRTPIAAIVGFGGLLDSGLEDMSIEEQRDFLGRLLRNATSLSSLVQDLLDFSRIGRASFRLHAEEVELRELADRVIGQLATPDQEHRYSIESPPRVWAFADSEAVERVLVNLLSNAAKYSPPDSAITVTLAQHGEAATIMVDDNGVGVSEEDRPHVFQRFFRGTSPAAMNTRGAGIGLAVVKDVVERLGGSVSVDAAPSGGARFTVVLPAHPSSESPAEMKGATHEIP